MSWPSTTIACQPKRDPAAGVGVHVVAERGRPALAERVDVDDARRGCQLVVARDVGRLPDRALGRLAVAEEHVGAVGRADAARVQRDADRRAQALAERAGRDVHERQARRGVPFEVRAELAAASAARSDRRRRPRPRPRRAAARRGPSTARSGRCRGPGGASGRTASRRRTASPRCRRPSSRWTDARCRRPSSSGSTRSGAGWRCCAGSESGRCRQALVTSRAIGRVAHYNETRPML